MSGKVLLLFSKDRDLMVYTQQAFSVLRKGLMFSLTQCIPLTVIFIRLLGLILSCFFILYRSIHNWNYQLILFIKESFQMFMKSDILRSTWLNSMICFTFYKYKLMSEGTKENTAFLKVQFFFYINPSIK